ncbi:zinc finger protein 511 lethal (2) k10201 [Colletes latitarsis]|uniref:zinc finger protein 511 lethal (2) k10201 n=1 Tax=Colletes latitarsis TaxID=2605962 RepID=UPI0040359EDC
MEEFLQNIGVGLRSIDDEFFEESYRACKIFQRKGITVEDDEELCHEVIREFPCYAAGCNATFQTLLDFEMHYNNYHRYVCIECKKALPSPRLLDIHIQEIHDSYFHVLSATQPMYQCYVSECNLKFNDSVERRNHCTNVHKFPKNFRFDNTPHYVKKEPKDKMDIDDPKHERKEPKTKKVQLSKNQKIKMFPPITRSTNIVKSNFNENQSCSSNPIVGASSLTFIPRQIQKSYTKALTNNQSNEKNVLETETMMDLAESLPT